jgi:drug/metabolite transporter (DMT)-like permease
MLPVGAPGRNDLAWRPVSRPVTWSLYALLVLVWSSTWVAIKFGLEETPPLLGAGIRFAVAGAGLLTLAAIRRRSLRTDAVLAGLLALLPFAAAYGLIYWAEQHVPSGLTAVLFGVMPLYVALLAGVLLPAEGVNPRLFLGLAVALAGLALAFGESLQLGTGEAALGAGAVLLAAVASAVGNVAIRIRATGTDPVVLNGWAMLAGGALLLVVSAVAERWTAARWSGQAFGAIAYLALFGSAIPFVVLTILLGELGAIRMSFLPLMLPFGALIFGAALYDEQLTLASIAGAALVVAGIVLGRRPARRGA